MAKVQGDQNVGGRGTLSEDVLVEAACRIVAERGLDGLTMRILAQELRVTQMATYHWVKSKNELLALMVNHVLSEVEIPNTEQGPWNRRLADLTERHMEALARYPGLANYALSTGKETSPGLRLAAAKIDILMSAGLSVDDAMLAYATIWSYMLGRLHVVEAQRSGGRRLENLIGVRKVKKWRGQDYVRFAIRSIISGVALEFDLPADWED